MSRRAKVIVISRRKFEQILGEQLCNFPGGAEIAAVQLLRTDGEPVIALRVHSETFQPTEHGEQLPIINAVFGSRGSE